MIKANQGVPDIFIPDDFRVVSPAKKKQPGTGSDRPLWMVEKDAIERAIAICDGNVPKAAALLEISASTIYRKRQAWETSGD